MKIKKVERKRKRKRGERKKEGKKKCLSILHGA
jgi:hypothetical protein